MQITSPLISVNGVLDAAISPLDRGFTYGDGLFETCRIHNGRIPLWNFHLERLEASAVRLGIPFDRHRLEDYCQQLFALAPVGTISAGVFKIILTRGVGGRGYRMPDHAEPTYCLGVFPAQVLQSDAYTQGVDIRICAQRLSHSPSLAGIKHLNRLEHILARGEWQDEYAEGVLLDVDDHVVEATVSNIFLVKDNQLITPELNRAGVAGIMRRLVLERLAPSLGIDVIADDVTLAAFLDADEIFLTNSIFGIWPVRSVAGFDHLSLKNLSARQFQQALMSYFDVQR